MSDQASITQALADYYRAVSAVDAQAIPPFFHYPCLLAGPQGMLAVNTPEELARAFKPALDGLCARGFGRSELSLERLEALSANTALASGVATRFKTDGLELDRAGVTYLLRKGDAGWKIAVLVVHDTERSQESL